MREFDVNGVDLTRFVYLHRCPSWLIPDEQTGQQVDTRLQVDFLFAAEQMFVAVDHQRARAGHESDLDVHVPVIVSVVGQGQRRPRSERQSQCQYRQFLCHGLKPSSSASCVWTGRPPTAAGR